MLKIAVLVSGSGSNLQSIIDQIEDKRLRNVKIQVVISNKPDVYALERADNKNIQTKVISKKDYKNENEFTEALLEEIDFHDVDLIVLAGFLLILPEVIINKYNNRIINVHPSLIPAFAGDGYYGLRVHEAALKRGVKVSGATVHFVDAGTDTGPIIIQRTVEVNDDDTPQSLQERIMREVEWKILPEAIGLIAEGKVVVENNRVKKGK